MEAMYNAYGYLRHHNHSTMVFDDAMIDWKDTDFNHYGWTDYYHEAKENILPNAPLPKGNPVQINAFLDANHSWNRVTRRSHAFSIAVDLIERLSFKLCMSAVPIDGPANVLSDNMAVIQNYTIPSSTIKKKHNAICYHRVREAVA